MRGEIVGMSNPEYWKYKPVALDSYIKEILAQSKDIITIGG